jgi:hypothetical protein
METLVRLAHPHQRLLGDDERPDQVDLENLLEVVEGNVGDHRRGGAHDRRAVHDHVEPALLGDESVHRSGHRPFVDDVHEVGLDPEGAKLLRHGPHRLLVEVEDGHVGALLRQPLDDGLSDPGGPSGDDGGLVGEPIREHVPSSPIRRSQKANPSPPSRRGVACSESIEALLAAKSALDRRAYLALRIDLPRVLESAPDQGPS